jgi:hypothetical protein
LEFGFNCLAQRTAAASFFLRCRGVGKKDIADGLTFHFYEQHFFDRYLKKNERMRPNIAE